MDYSPNHISYAIRPAVEKSRPKKSARPSNAARIFEQARNVILKAEKKLAAIGYPGAKGALRRGLRRSISSSSQESLYVKSMSFGKRANK